MNVFFFYIGTRVCLTEEIFICYYGDGDDNIIEHNMCFVLYRLWRCQFGSFIEMFSSNSGFCPAIFINLLNTVPVVIK